MATWITHLRVAENLLESYDLYEREFIAGNIGPDSGVPNEDWTSFNPPKRVTHWLGVNAKSGNIIDGRKIDAESFYKKYIEEKMQDIDGKKLSFLLGYYVHLLTDIEWSKMHRIKMETDLEYSKRLQKDSNFIWEVKQDWYGLDFEYIKEKKDNVFNTKFIRIQNITDYIDYFPKGAFALQIKYIQEFYQTKGNEFNPTGRYLTSFEMDKFVKVTSSFICKKLGTRLSGYSLKVKG